MTEEIKQEKKVLTKKETHKRFVEKNCDKIKEQTICKQCFGCYTYFNKSNHMKSKRHLRAIENAKKIDE